MKVLTAAVACGALFAGGCVALGDFAQLSGPACTEADLTAFDETFTETFDVTDPDGTAKAAYECMKKLTGSLVTPGFGKTKRIFESVSLHHRISCPGVSYVDQEHPVAMLDFALSEDRKKATISLSEIKINVAEPLIVDEDPYTGERMPMKTEVVFGNTIPQQDAQYYRDEAQQWISTMSECIRTRDYDKYRPL